MTRRRAVQVICLALLALACARPPASDDAGRQRAAADRPQTAAISFTDITEAAGVDFVHQNFATPKRYLPETMGAGVAVFDMDGDELPDLFFVDGAPVAADVDAGPRPAGAVYRNLGDGTFENVTRGAGLGQAFPAMGTAVGDIDNDGRLDLFVSGVGEQRLYRNLGPGDGQAIRFEDITVRSGLAQRHLPDDLGFGTSAAFLDVDGDGRLDLYVGRYVPWTPAGDVRCSPNGEHHTYCTPEVYAPAANVFYRNLGPGGAGVVRFEDQTAAWGLGEPKGKTLGVAVLDHDRDGRPDVAVANDTDRNHLMVQSAPGGYEDIAVASGMAFSVSGATRGAMGIDAGDVDGDGLVDLAVGNFAQEMTAIYTATANGLYRDEAAALGIGLPSLMQVAFGTLLVDLDLDGRLDLVLANGHIEPEIRQYQAVQSYAQPLGVYRNVSTPERSAFERITGDQLGDPLAATWVGRGLAAADLDGDGDLDLVLTQNGRAARILRNDAPPSGWLRVRLEGRTSNRTGYGATVRLVQTAASPAVQERYLGSGRSYLSASEPVLTFGLGHAPLVDRLEVDWSSGVRQLVEAPQPNQLLVLREPLD